VVTTHAARHTGTLMLGSDGDTNLKEKALGHAGIYDHDAPERYGPALLKAWKMVLGATELNAPKNLPHKPRNKLGLTGGGTLIRLIKGDNLGVFWVIVGDNLIPSEPTKNPVSSLETLFFNNKESLKSYGVLSARCHWNFSREISSNQKRRLPDG